MYDNIIYKYMLEILLMVQINGHKGDAYMFDERVTDMLNILYEGITVIDTNGRIIFCNIKAAELDNIDLHTAIGRHILEVYPSLSEKTSTLLNVLNTGEEIHDNIQAFQNYKGEKITTINTTIPIKKNKKIIGALEVSRDITIMRQLSEEVLDLKTELFQRINFEDEYIKNGKNSDSKKYIKEKSSEEQSLKGYTFMDIIGHSDSILKLKSYALKASQSSSPVLVYGETGTGKELFVQSIHNSSPRGGKPFVAQNCAAIPSSLLEGILFGTVKGSFTGAEDRPGLFELADGGTLYLDEINSTPLDLQAKLLRVLQDGYIRRVGDIKERKVDVRIITSTNMEPWECVEKGIIRKDFFYRINVIYLKIPELKERKYDIPILFEHFLKKYNDSMGRRIQGITNEAMERMICYEWPGNVRELQHVIEGVMNIKESGYIDIEDLPSNIRNSQSMSLAHMVDSCEIKIVQEALRTWKGNVSKTAQYLGIPRQTLQYKMKKYDIK